MWRSLVLAGAWAAAAGAASLLWLRGPAGDLAAFGRVALLAGLLGLAAALPLVLSLRADRLRVPWRDMARWVVRESPVEAAVLGMLAVSAVVAVFPFGAGASLATMAALGAVAVAGVAAATVQNVFAYLEPRTPGPGPQRP